MQDRYELISEIGRGGMGVVWLGHDRNLDRRVAIKFFNSIGTKEEQLRAQREAQVLAGITHPNLVGVYALTTDETSGKLGMVFDFIEGEPLSELIKDGPIPHDLVSQLFSQLCCGLDALHAAGVVHRDIKPSNLIVSRERDHLTIIDFGLAKSTTEDVQRLTSTGTMLGTPAYMSPEQFSRGTVGIGSDLYSAACVLYEMITGNQVFIHDSLYMVAQSHLLDPVPTTNNAPLDSFFARALAKQAEDRFFTAREMDEAFQRALAGKSIIASAKLPAVQISAAPHTVHAILTKHWMPACIAIVSIALLATAWHFLASHSDVSQGTEEASYIHTEVQTIIHDAERPIHEKDYDAGRAIIKKGITELEARGGPKINPNAMVELYLDYAKYCTSHEADDGFDSEEGAKALEKTIALLKPDSPNVVRHRLALAGQYFLIGNLKKALSIYGESKQALIKERNEHYDEAVAYGHALLEAGRPQECIALLEPTSREISALSDSHNAFRLRRYLAEAYVRNGQPKLAIPLLRPHMLLQANDEPLQDRLKLAYALALTGDARESRAYIQEALVQPDWKRHERQSNIQLDLIQAANGVAEKKPNETVKWLMQILHEKEYFNLDHGKETKNHRYDRIRFVYDALTKGAALADKVNDAKLKSEFESLRTNLRNETADSGTMLPP